MKQAQIGSGSFTFIIRRHGNASKAATDFERMLSDKGRQQSADMQRKLDELGEAYKANVALASTAPRAIESLAPAFGAEQVTKLPALYPIGVSPELDKLFELGYAPLREYHAKDPEGLLTQWVAQALDAVMTALSELAPPANGVTVVQIGFHAVVSNALALAFLGDRNPEGRDLILDTQLGEACCIVVHHDGRVEFLEP